jgi:hypothetical protein
LIICSPGVRRDEFLGARPRGIRKFMHRVFESVNAEAGEVFNGLQLAKTILTE